ncbi:RDD family protein [Flavobacterium sp. MK4S-17]|uniref:RDD family protein n=1 Tax=Flavobacterium sp. MK4S-17 TaxID=2543737 RepID=UPI00135BC15E|nr:RDD family protein [Flavobacterium sp. MK4S-17]
MSQLSITTTQNVNINFNTASVGDRIFGYLFDLLVKIAYGISLYFILFRLLKFDETVFAGFDMWERNTVILIISLPVIFYSLVQESLMEGQTIGKRIMKIRVIKIDGYQASFGDYFIRWVLRLIDISIGSGIIGLIAMLVNNKTQRLGDMAAGTAVISLKNDVTIDHTILKELDNSYVPTYPLVIKLSDNDMRIIKETYDTSYNAADFDMIEKLKEKIEAVTGIRSVSHNATAFVDTVIKDYNYYTQNM